MSRARAVAGLAAFAVLLCWSRGAEAYRPFDGTDAAVAEPGQVEIEFGPVGYSREGPQQTLFAPATVVNYGFAEGWEAVVEGRAAHRLSGGVGGSSLVDSGAFLKAVLREGALQEKAGPSIATEFGVLLPGIRDEHGAGASVAAIVSQRWDWGTTHLNAAASLTRQHHADLFVGAIVEGPHDWPVRPVAELSYERDTPGFHSAALLLGAIWQIKDETAIDVGLRGGRVNNRGAGEIRAGVTFAFPLR